MGRLRVLSGAQVCSILASHGFKQTRQRGSHVVMQKQVNNTTLTVVVPAHAEVRAGTLRSIIRQSKLPRELFEED